MAIYHLSIKIISRGKGKSAVAAAAYRAGEKIANEYDGLIHDYTHKGGVVHTEILLPDHAPAEYENRAVLWNAVEKTERAKNSQLAREIELALAVELTIEQNISLVCEYAKRHFVDKGMCIDLAIHDKNDGNPHAHIMLTMRPINEDGTWGAKSKKEYILDGNGEKILLKSGEFKTRKINATDWNDRGKAEEWRAVWAESINTVLERQKIETRIDHRSYTRQGVEKIPTVHLGVAAFQMEKRGIRTERGDVNRAAEVSNNRLRQLKARINKCKNWLYSQPLENAPTMVRVMSRIADGRNLESRWHKTADLKTRADVLVFLQSNDITGMEQLVGKVTEINERFYEVSNKIKAADRRLDTLNTHLAQYDNYKQYKPVYEKYRQLDPKKRGVFYDRHSEEMQIYEAAGRYLESVMNGKTALPVKAWRAEAEKLGADRFMLCEDYYRLQDEVRSVEALRRCAENIMREHSRERQHTRSRDMEL